MNAYAPLNFVRGTADRLLQFDVPSWPGFARQKLMVMLTDGQPWFQGTPILNMLGKEDHQRGPIYDRTPAPMLRKIGRARVGLSGSGNSKAAFFSLAGVQRLLRLQRAAERRAGGGRGADILQDFLTATVLPEVEEALGAAGLWAGAVEVPPPAPELTEAQVRAILLEREHERFTVMAYATARKLDIGKNQRDELGKWCSDRCRALGIPVPTKGVRDYPRRILDEGAHWKNFAALPKDRL